jgi:hypothetical protein
MEGCDIDVLLIDMNGRFSVNFLLTALSLKNISNVASMSPVKIYFLCS